MERIVIVGAGHAGIQLADSLREEGFTGPITVLGDEPGLPYQRPPLSKDYLVPGAAPTPLPLRGKTFFSDRDIDYHPGATVTALDPAIRTLTLSDGQSLGYTELVLATGARNRTLDATCGRPAGVHYLKSLTDAQQLHAELTGARRVVVVGAGFIGLEFATAARARGLEVTVLEFAPRVMARALSEPMSAYFEQAHTEAGIDLKLGEGIASFEHNGDHVTAAVGTSGTAYRADLVLVGVGVVPNAEIAAAAAVAVDNGVAVDEYLRTSEKHIWAIGDCASFPNTHTSTRTRLESVQNATDQAAVLAKTLTGTPTVYRELPWFWSIQGKHKLQIAGIAGSPDHTVVRGDPASGKFSLFCYQHDALTAVESVNSPADHLAARRLLIHRMPLTPHQAADPSFDLKGYSRESVVV
ncbi:NAD(P)/FAD-dependent oxidoreductase [Kocuria sp. M4R2S49]|uniref:NAD(P)/FAD-dependent oxidoreductase n=1 Tax=Kocuria rhizosphaericola TaxID=3376284 RepID=UPI0037A2FD5D